MSALLFFLVALALAGIQVLRGGTRMAFALPAYAVLALAAVLSVAQIRRLRLTGNTGLYLFTSVLFFGYAFVRTLWSPEEYLARTNLFLLSGVIIVYFLTALNIIPSRLQMGLVAVLLALGCADTLIGFVQFTKGSNYLPFSFLGMRPAYEARASGFYISPNHLAGFFEIAMFLGLAVTWWSRWPLYARIVCGYGSLMCLGGLLMTGSRGGYASAACGLLVFLFLSVRASWVRQGQWLSLVAIVCFCLGLGWIAKKAITGSPMLEDRAATMALKQGDARAHLGAAALKQATLNRWFGTGASTYLYYGRQFRSVSVQKDPIYAHNDYLQFLAEYGIVGLIAAFLFLIAHIDHVFTLFTGSRSGEGGMKGMQSNTLALRIGALSSVAAYLVHSLLDFNLHIPPNALSMAFVFGILANPGRRDAEESSGAEKGFGYVLGISLACFGLWLGLAVLPKIPAEYYSEQVRLLLANGDYLQSPEVAKTAEGYARQGLGHDPINPELYGDLAECQYAQAQIAQSPAREELYEASVHSYRQALELAPLDRNLVLYLGWSLDALKHYDESEPVFQRALQLDPNSGEVHWAYAVHLQAQGRMPEAEKEYRLANNLGSVAAQLALEKLMNEK